VVASSGTRSRRLGRAWRSHSSQSGTSRTARVPARTALLAVARTPTSQSWCSSASSAMPSWLTTTHSRPEISHNSLSAFDVRANATARRRHETALSIESQSRWLGTLGQRGSTTDVVARVSLRLACLLFFGRGRSAKHRARSQAEDVGKRRRRWVLLSDFLVVRRRQGSSASLCLPRCRPRSSSTGAGARLDAHQAPTRADHSGNRSPCCAWAHAHTHTSLHPTCISRQQGLQGGAWPQVPHRERTNEQLAWAIQLSHQGVWV
jgi:hypothetical protein